MLYDAKHASIIPRYRFVLQGFFTDFVEITCAEKHGTHFLCLFFISGIFYS